ncbi:MAG TPA: putative manganese-dependent inorganic diphosphatase [Opitutaceae bacterium]|nr:putative manganese-dependent inorganic diphosphatase [Opitutaceae bacterium]
MVKENLSPGEPFVTLDPSYQMTSYSPPPESTFIVGHKNPDADAICSAIAYAAFKEARGEKGYIAARCGNSNARIDTILGRFRQPLPYYISDVTPRVRDVMIRDVVTVNKSATCAEALELIDRHDVRLLPVVDEEARLQGIVTIFQLGSFFIPKVSEPREMRHVHTSLANIVRAIKAKVLYAADENRVEELYVRIGAMDIRSFGRFSDREGIPSNQTVIIVGDRWDIQQRSIQNGVRLLVITGNLPVEDEVVQTAKSKGVSLIVSPYDSATTAWVIRTASTVERLIDRKFASISSEARLSEVRKKIANAPAAALLVQSDGGHLEGIITRTDILKPVKTRLVLVDHNEMSQAVSGAEQVSITEIIDHHRLGSLNTSQPILFINEPVGSTCTIVADLFRRNHLTPSADLAGIMMSGLISDTLNLNSPTSTDKDAEILTWLSKIADVNPRELAETIFSSGSVILSTTPDKVVRSDFKIYEEENVRFAVSQVEELGFGNFWGRWKDLCHALAHLREQEALAFACLLVTDINTQNSLLLVKGDPDFISRIHYAHVEKDEIFDLPGIVSRKKQLIPFIDSILKEMAAEGSSPSTRNANVAAAQTLPVEVEIKA